MKIILNFRSKLKMRNSLADKVVKDHNIIIFEQFFFFEKHFAVKCGKYVVKMQKQMLRNW